MSMEPSLFFPPPKIKVENDASDVIDLESDKTPEDLVYEWHSKVRTKIKDYFIIESEGSLDTLMKWYIDLLKEEAVNLEQCQILKVLAAKHLQLFKLYFVELNCCFVDNYLGNMEEILTIYSGIEVKSLPRKPRDGNKRAYKKFLSSVCRRIISMLNFYLLNREDRMYHVMMRIKLNLLSEESKELLNLLYGKFLTKEPKDKTDLGFCRAYILYQKWKTLRKPDDWQKMDEVMYKLYNRTPESVKNNETLKQILLPQNNSVLDTLLHITEKHLIISEEYFKFVGSLKLQEESVILPEISDIEISDSILPDLGGDDEDEEFNKAYSSFVKSMSALAQSKSGEEDCLTIKIEDDDEDDCLIVGVSAVGHNSEDTDLIHEILDDDDIEIIYFKKKEQQTTTQKERPSRSFLESIEIPDHSEVPIEKVSSSTTIVLASQTAVTSSVTTPTSTMISQQLSSPLAVTSSVTTPTSALISQQLSSPLRDLPVQELDVFETSVTVPNMENRTTPELSSLNVNKDTSSDGVQRIIETLPDTEGSSRHLPEPAPAKTLITTETQTDDFSQVISADNIRDCHCHKKDMDSLVLSDKPDGMCTGYYYYGLVTPPSDLPSDEHSTPTTDGSAYSNVYADIVRTHDRQEETDCIAKVSESNYLLPSTEDMKNLPTSSGIDKATNFTQIEHEVGTNKDQSHSRSDYSNMSFEMEFEPELQAMEKESSLEAEDSCSSPCNSVPAADQDVVLESNGRKEDTAENIGLGDVAHRHDSNLVSEICSTQEIQEKLPESSTNICVSPEANKMLSVVVTSRSPSPNKCNDVFKTPSVLVNVPCTSTDLIVSSQDDSSSTSLNVQSEPVSTPCPSPDITSTSTDVQDCAKNFNSQGTESDGNRTNSNVSEAENLYSNNETYSVGYVHYSECNGSSVDFTSNENVSQSNLEDGEEIFIEEPVLLTNEEELSLIIEEALPVGANINICMENHCDESSVNSDLSSPVNNTISYEIEQPEVPEKAEKLNGDMSKDSVSPVKELIVALERDDKERKINNGKLNSRKIIFTSSEKVKKLSLNDFSRFEETIQVRWNQLKEVHNFDEIFCGPIAKILGVNSRNNSNSSSPKPANIQQASTTLSSANSVGDVSSPAYEGIDDFKSYYEENKTKGLLGVSSPQKVTVIEDKVVNTAAPVKNNKDAQIYPKDLKSMQGREVGSSDSSDKEKSPTVRAQNSVKRMRIAFAENIVDSSNSIAHSPIDSPNGVLQGILKKPSSDGENVRLNGKRVTRPRIPRRLMNLKSLAQYNVKPSDPCIQGVPCVIIERLSDGEISQWLRVSEISRKIRLQKQRAQFASTQSIFRVDYDKQTSHINENDVVRYNTPDGISVPQSLGHWRSNSILHNKSSRLDEGMVAPTPSTNFNDNDCNSIPIPCRNACCSSLTADLSNLNVSRTLPNLSCCNPRSGIKCFGSHSPVPNPFLLVTDKTKRKRRCRKDSHNYHNIADLLVSSEITCNDNEDLTVSLVSNLADNFDFKCKSISLDLNQTELVGENNLPAVVPEVEEFEKTIKIEEMTKGSSIPSDLYNLNLRKFSPSPIINCFSPQSDSPNHTFPSETCPIENTSLLSDNDNFSLKIHHIYDDIANFVKSSDDFNDVKSEVDATLNIQNSSQFTVNSDLENKNINTFAEIENGDKCKDNLFETCDSKDGIKLEVLTKLDANLVETEAETRLPLKKRKHSVANPKEEALDDEIIGPDLVEEIIKRARAEKTDKEDISYPAKPMISIAEIQEKLVEPHPRVFKTPAERKEMPPAPVQAYGNSLETAKIVTEQYNNHTYNNPTINYHMNNVPYPFFPCASLPYFPSILLPINSTTTFDVNLVNQRQSSQQQAQQPSVQEPVTRPRKERRSKGRKKN